MPFVLLALHALGALLAGLAGRRSVRAGLTVGAVPPLIAAAWAISRIAGSSAPSTHEFSWVDALDLTIRLRSDQMALLMVLIVSGIGAAVFAYAVGYFAPTAAGGSRFPSTLVAFAGSMLGLVLADSVWTLFIFWEFTTVTSFLLVGHKFADPAVGVAARRALIVTGAGGLALLAGLLVLTGDIGTGNLSELVPTDGGAGRLAAVLIMIGAATKSAQVPFHVWLPGAMAAPTPVSAYLHSATMVKAGVVLIAVLGPAFVDVAAWKILGVGFGGVTMLWGAIGALRQRDAKLILAWGTVSQLGLLVALLSLGSAKATFAAISILVAHAVFKAALFLVVGDVDIRTGTRDIAALGGLWRSMPITCAAAVAAGLSMMGAPPLLGFMAKEAAIEAAVGLTGSERAVVLAVIVAGSVLTVAYTVRFLIGVFGPGPDTVAAPARAAMTVPLATLGAASVAGFLLNGVVNDIVVPAASELDAGAASYHLIRWPGLTTAFVISICILVVGALVGSALSQRDIAAAPARGAAGIDRGVDRLLAFAPRATSAVQHGSLPVYLTTMAIAASVAAVPFLNDVSFDHLVWWDHPLQGVLSVVILVAAVGGAFVRSRLGAALTLGAIGAAVSGLFVIHGAPDLALTQLLVETVIVVGFVIGLGHLADQFPPISDAWNGIRVLVSAIGGLAVMAALVAAGSAPTGSAPVDDLAAHAVDEGGGNNIVNVILTDIRALDTLGEVVVLATVAVGILALARSRTPGVTA